MNFCTIADKNYLTKALAMYQSLCDNVDDFTLYFLAIDEYAYYNLIKLSLPNIKIFLLSNLEDNDIELQTAKDNPATKYGTQYSQYCWTLTPYFTNYVLSNFIESNEYLMYVDADIYFYNTPQIILDEMKEKSVGIHTHRFTPPFKEVDTGWYNCGIVVFKNDFVGIEISNKWKSWLLNQNNEYFEKYGTCGDQKYLELFQRFCDVCVFDENILHGAPWCCNDLKGKNILWYHFSHFNYTDTEYKDNYKGEWKPTAHSFIKPYYDNYFKVIQQKKKILNG